MSLSVEQFFPSSRTPTDSSFLPLLLRKSALCWFLCAGAFMHGVALADPMPLWLAAAPGALGNATTDVPTLARYAPSGPRSTTTMVILPGGGYGSLARHEGEGFARWFASQGITCYVVNYRLGSAGYRHPAMLQDTARAVRIARFLGREEGLDPGKIVLVGSSAGGHLVSTLLTHFDSGDSASPDPIERESSRPDAGILCYRVVTLEGPFAEEGSRKNLLGPDPDPALVRSLSNERQVTAQTPPCFL